MAIIPLQLRLVYRIGADYGQKLDGPQIRDLLGAMGIGAAAQVMDGLARPDDPQAGASPPRPRAVGPPPAPGPAGSPGRAQPRPKARPPRSRGPGGPGSFWP